MCTSCLKQGLKLFSYTTRFGFASSASYSDSNTSPFSSRHCSIGALYPVYVTSHRKSIVCSSRLTGSEGCWQNQFSLKRCFACEKMYVHVFYRKLILTQDNQVCLFQRIYVESEGGGVDTCVVLINVHDDQIVIVVVLDDVIVLFVTSSDTLSY